MSVFTKTQRIIKLLLNDDETRWNLLELAITKLHKKASIGEYQKNWHADHDLNVLFEKIPAPRKYHERLYNLIQFANHAKKLPGEFVECGTYTGSSAYFLGAIANPTTTIQLFDSWQGLSQPGEEDGNYWQAGSLSSNLKSTKELLTNHKNYIFNQGWIPKVFDSVDIQQVSFLHLDLDLYAPTKSALEFFWPRLVQNGFVIFDDYGFSSCPGVKQAALEFFGANAEIIELSTGQAFIRKNSEK